MIPMSERISALDEIREAKRMGEFRNYNDLFKYIKNPLANTLWCTHRF